MYINSPNLSILRENLFNTNSSLDEVVNEKTKEFSLAGYNQDVDDILINNSYILFDDKKPSEKYGVYNHSSLFKEAGKVRTILDEFPGLLPYLNEKIDILIDGQCSEESIKQSEIISALPKLIENEEMPNELRKALNNLLKKLKNRIRFIYVNGLYDSINKKIILYLNNIFNLPEGNNDFNSFDFNQSSSNFRLVFETYCHEMFHLFHFNAFCPGNKGYLDSVVNESLAAAFEYWFIEDRYGYGGHEIDIIHNEWSVLTYPYVGAWFIIYFDEILNWPIEEFVTQLIYLSTLASKYSHNPAIDLLLIGKYELKDLLKKY